MSSGKGHLLFGLICIFGSIFLISNYFFKPSIQDIVFYIVIGLLFALWPDVDTKSIGQKVFYTLFLNMDVYLIYNQEFRTAAYFGLIIILPVLAKHRGWTHSRLAMVIVPLPILFYPIYQTGTLDLSNLPLYAIAVTGYFSHLLIDGKIF